jgi:hypothetical protein
MTPAAARHGTYRTLVRAEQTHAAADGLEDVVWFDRHLVERLEVGELEALTTRQVEEAALQL